MYLLYTIYIYILLFIKYLSHIYINIYKNILIIVSSYTTLVLFISDMYFGYKHPKGPYLVYK